VTAFAVLASLLALHLVGPRPVLGPRDAPRVIAMIGYSGQGYSGTLTLTISARGGTIRPQRGTHCDPRPRGAWSCYANPLHQGSTEPLSFLVTGLRAGTPLVVDASVRSPQASARATLVRPVRA
jgi:hypothetical protein